MFQSTFITFLICALQSVILVQSSGLYSVIGPYTIHSNSNYSVVVSLHKAEEPCKIQIAIKGPSYKNIKDVVMQPMSKQIVEFDVSNLRSGDYELIATLLGRKTFEDSMELKYIEYKPMIFIQTDKATYKPGDRLQYRVLFLDENTRPARINKPITITITDGAQNQIKRIKNVNLTKGVYSGDLQLSEQPVLGAWKITASVKAEHINESKLFLVAKYVLANFKVSIDTSTNIYMHDRVLKATVQAKYTFGKPVRGKAHISLKPALCKWGTIEQVKTINIDGKADIELDLSEVAKCYESSLFPPPLMLFAEVEEVLTGTKQNASARVRLHSKPYRIVGKNYPLSYVPDKPFAYIVVITNLYGAPVQDTKNKVKLTFKKAIDDADSNSDSNSESESDSNLVTSSSSGEKIDLEDKAKKLQFESVLDENGMAKFMITLPKGKKNYKVFAKFLEYTRYLSTISRFKSKLISPELLQLKVITEKPRLGKDVSVKVKFSEPTFYFIYIIVARGNILKSELVELSEDQQFHIIKFRPIFAMIPSAVIYVHYVYKKQLRYGEKKIIFQKDFRNYIEIIAPNETKPNTDVELKIKTEPGSFVGLLGVDQNVMLLKSGNDLDRNGIFSRLEKYSSNSIMESDTWSYPGMLSGVVTLTNAKYSYRNDSSSETEEASGDDNISLAQFGYDQRSHKNKKQSVTTGEEVKLPIRKDAIEVFLWQSVEHFNVSRTDKAGLTIVKKIPDTITSWVITGFSLNPETGIALTKNPSKIRVFQPFFISTNLPYSVKRGEVIAIPVIVFNYMEMLLDAEVTMDNTDGEFEYINALNETDIEVIDEKIRRKSITVPPNSGKSVSFLVCPKNVGTMTFKIIATTPMAGDSIQQQLKIEPEGVTQFVNRAVFINLKNQSEFRDKLDVNVPAEAVPNSEYIEFSVVGDLLGPTIKNLDNLVRMPYGSGEQNMVNFVPNILVLKYLEATNQKLPAVTEKAKKFLEIGYQRELTYKHDDGSYSAFGKSDKMGSTWLTAYVMRSFHQAAKYTDVDPKIVKEGLDFLAAKQNEKGEFPEFGKLFDNSHQNALGLTSFVLLAFFENQELVPEYESLIRKAVEYVAQEVDYTDDQYSLSIAVVALQLANHPKSDEVLAKLESVSKKENDWKWWSNAAKNTTETDDRWYWKPQSNDVEITSYVLLALLERDEAESMLPIVKWLIAQRNSNGGFSSTQDTVIGLQALTKFAYKIGSGSGDIDIDFVSSENTENKGAIKVNPDNALVLQTHVLPKTTRQVAFTAKGKGTAMVQLSYRYNIADKEKKPSFQFKPITVKVTPAKELFLSICATYTPTDTKGGTSNMVIMEVALPSGYTVDMDSFENIETVNGVARIETKNSETIGVIYFVNVKVDEEKCLPIWALRSHAVAKQKPVPVTIYDYYDTSRRATEYYQVSSSFCDICESDDCGSGCTSKQR